MDPNHVLQEILSPLRLTHRQFRGDADIQAYVDLNNTCDRADDVDNVDTVEAACLWFATADLADPILIESVDGKLVARGSTDSRQLLTHEWLHDVEGRVHPAWRRKGIGRAVLRWLEVRAHEVAAGRTHERSNAPTILQAQVRDQIIGKTALFVSEGYRPTRYGYVMMRDLRESIPEVMPPLGIEIRPVRHNEMRQAWEAWRESFRDHFGYSESDWTDKHYEEFIAYPGLDPGLWRVAWAGDEVVGGCEIILGGEEDAILGVKRGWFDLIGIRRPWRRRGIARAAITSSLTMLRNIGIDEGALGVDALNPSHALPLYESLGFKVRKSTTIYQKKMERVQ